jgi:UDP:flavonoid glycosyltransferase YjiC (YdhE family)
LADDRPLSSELETFLDVGEPPVYFGFGSIRAPKDLSKTMVESARAVGRRAIVSQFDVAVRARRIATEIRSGAFVAAQRLISRIV